MLSRCFAAFVVSLVLAQETTTETSPPPRNSTTVPQNSTTEPTSTVTTSATTPTTTTTTSTTSTTTSASAVTKYCPIGWCLDDQWFKGGPCITPSPKDLRKCWNDFCTADANRRGIHPTNAQGRGQGTYCKDWQDPKGRICFHDIKLSCHCDSFNSTPFSLSPRDGWSVADPCSYPPPPEPTTTESPTTSGPTGPTTTGGSGTTLGPASDAPYAKVPEVVYLVLSMAIGLFLC
ncbi:hypothetical protein FOL47_000889 [Perkinsus chesapeaki]|uniref:Uncharacterized protein n=1 Tax=Perkinsus chesapeaki TaxID=330153 RepID=A0A7J6MKK0_PERCH|nr:hypothetical protein FOL47_000889 [Perkinsus chesapeaki]